MLAAAVVMALAVTALPGCRPDRRPRNPSLAGPVPDEAFQHTLVYGDSLDELSRRYGRPPEAILEANNLRPPYLVREGDRLLIPARPRAVAPEPVSVAPRPEASRTPPPATARRTPEAAAPASPARRPTAVPARTPPPARTPSPVMAAAPAPPRASTASVVPDSATRRSSSAGLRWPLAGALTRTFSLREGSEFHGIDIDAPAGARVCAAGAGKVAATGNLVEGYGRMVIIQHSRGYTTVYANLKDVLVKANQRVEAGQAIATVGQSGSSASPPHLHFQVRRNTKPVDPVRCLPSL